MGLLVAKARSMLRELEEVSGLMAAATSAFGLLTAIAATYVALVVRLSEFLAGWLTTLVVAGNVVAMPLSLLAAMSIWWRPKDACRLAAWTSGVLGLNLAMGGAAVAAWALTRGKNPLALLVPIVTAFGFAALMLGAAAAAVRAFDRRRSNQQRA